MQALLTRFKKSVLALLVLGSMALAQVASAAHIELDVWISGYGYVVVKNGANTGGRILWDATHGYYYTDRVNRGERVYIFATPSSGESTAPNSTLYGIWCDSKDTYLVGPRQAPWEG